MIYIDDMAYQLERHITPYVLYEFLHPNKTEKPMSDEQQNKDTVAKQVYFERLAESRMANLIKRFHNIGELADKTTYAYTDQHVKQIIDAIEAEMKQIKEKFKKGKAQKIDGFTFRH